MSTSLELLKPAAAPPDFAPLSEAVWQAWLAKGRASAVLFLVPLASRPPAGARV